MNSNCSYFQKNPLCGLTAKIKEKVRKRPPRPPQKSKKTVQFTNPLLSSELHKDENKFIRDHPKARIYDLKYYSQRSYRSLPITGWIKPCVECRAQTGSTVIFCDISNLMAQHFRIHICQECVKHHNNKLFAVCKKLIIKHRRAGTYYLSLM